METGELNLKNIVIPMALHPRCEPAVDSVVQLVTALGIETVALHLLHVGSQSTLPVVPRPPQDNIRLNVHIQDGDIVPTILQFAKSIDADLVAMTTAGHHGFLDALRGSTTEQVLRQIDCPLWTIY
jgi:nucleotide-binding universal stress UspA family protein